MSLDDILHKATIETVRWVLLRLIDAGQEYGVSERLLVRALNDAEGITVTVSAVRRELNYLQNRKMISVNEEQDGLLWIARITSLGTDIVEYTVACHPGIARPPRR